MRPLLIADNLFSIAREGTTVEGDPVEYLFKNVVPTTESKITLTWGSARVLPLPSEGGRVAVYLAISQFAQGKRGVPVVRGDPLHLAELVSVGHSGYSY